MPIRRTEFDSGLRVVTERMPGVRSVSLGFWVLAGSRDERPAISGSSHFLEHLLFKGTKTRSALDIAEQFDAVGGDVNAFTAKEYTCYYARVLDRDLEMAVDHLADMLQHTVIRKADLDGERQVILEEINMHEDAPEDVVHDLFTETLWPDHPLGRPILGTVGTIEAATTASVGRFYRGHYVPGNFVVAAAGNLRHEELVALLHQRMETGREVGEADPSVWNLRAPARAPAPSGRGAHQTAEDRAGQHLPGDERPPALGSRPVRVPDREHGAGWGDVLPPVPGGPREARPRLLRVQLPRAVHRGRRVRLLRGLHAEPRPRGDRASFGASSPTWPAADSPPRSSSGPRATSRAPWCWDSKTRAGA